MDVNVLALVKQKTGEQYVWIYTDDQRTAVLRSIGRFAANPELSFTRTDAAVLSQRVRLGLENA